MPKKKKSNLGRSTNSAKRMRLSRNNHSQMHHQNMVEVENNITNNTNDNNDNNHNDNTSDNNNTNRGKPMVSVLMFGVRSTPSAVRPASFVRVVTCHAFNVRSGFLVCAALPLCRVVLFSACGRILRHLESEKLCQTDMKSPTQIEERDRQFLQDRNYLSETTYDANHLSIFVQENLQKLTDDQR
ncbi:hypothetical protein QTP88_009826 [Uroleucon formosanum]